VTDRHSSNTAFRAATLRAVHQLIDEEPKILNDPVVLRLLDASTIDHIRLNPNEVMNGSLSVVLLFVVSGLVNHE